MADKDLSDKVISGLSRATGWTRDFTADVLSTAGGALVAYFAFENIPLVNLLPYSGVVAACITSAMLWKRHRRDNA